MRAQAFNPAPVVVPSMVLAEPEVCAKLGGPVVEIQAGGEVGGLALEAGDQLLLDPGALPGELVVVAPRGRGRPMLATHTESGPLALPSGVRCSPIRWRVLGRVVLHLRAEPARMEQVLGFPDRAQASLPLSPGSLVGPVVVMRFSRAPAQEMVDFVAARHGALRVQGVELVFPLPKGLQGLPGLSRLGASVREISERFGARLGAAIAEAVESAQVAAELLPAGGVALVPAGQELERSGETALAALPHVELSLDSAWSASKVQQLTLF